MTVRRSPPSTPLLIEIVGPAGAGKSTLTRLLVARDPSMTLLPSARRAGDAADLVKAGIAAVPALLNGMSVAPRFLAQQIRHLLRLSTLDQRIRRASGSGRTILLDEGPAYTLARLAAFSPAELTTGRFAEHLRRASRHWSSNLHLVIRIDAPDVVLVERIRGRQKAHRMRDRTDAELHSFLRRYRSAYDGVLAELGVPVLALDSATEPATRLADSIGEQLEGNFSGSAPAPLNLDLALAAPAGSRV